MAEHSAPNPPREPVSDLLLERYALGELPRGLRLRLEMRLGSDPGLRSRLDALRASDEAILKEHSPEAFAGRLELLAGRLDEELHREPEQRRHRAWFAWRLELPRGAAPALTAFALLAILAIPVWLTLQESGGGSPVGETSFGNAEVSEDVTRIKGLEPGLALFRRTERGAEPLQPGAVAKPGDVLRVGYRSGGFPYGAIFSVDGNGSVTRHWPPAGESAARLESGETLLPGAFELDAAPEYERFYLLVSERAFELNPVLESLHVQKPLSGRDIKVVRFDILKENGI